jgi:flagellar biosynthesis/type III secretory pathway protein FliH
MSWRDRAPDAQGAHVPALADLDRLVEAERRLEALVADTRAEAARIVAAAQEAGHAREQLLERECQEALAAARMAIEIERDREIAGIAADAERRAQAFDAVPPERVAQLAKDVVRRVIGEPPDREDA